MTLRKVSPGDPLRITAEAFNAFIDAAQAVQAGQINALAPPGSASTTAGVLLVRNDSGADQDRFAVLGLAVPLILPSENPQAFAQRLAFSVIPPDQDKHAERFVVLQEPIAASALGRAMAIGVTPARVDVGDEADAFATIATDRVDALVSSPDAGARMLWKEPGTGIRHAVVLLPAVAAAAGGDANLVIEARQTAHGFQLGDVVRWTGTAWELANGATVADIDALGVIGRIADDDTVFVVLWGLCCVDGLLPHTDYWLDATILGGLTPVKPTATVARLVLHHSERRLCVVNPGGGAAATRFADLTDVDLSTEPEDGQVPAWDAADERWTPTSVVHIEPVPAHQVLVGPADGDDAEPTFRDLVAGDLPELPPTSVLANPTGASGRPEAVAADADHVALQRVDGVLRWLQVGSETLADDAVVERVIADGAVTDPKIVSLDYGKLTDVPAEFPPEPHDHVVGGDLTGRLADARLGEAVVGEDQIAPGAVRPDHLAEIPGPSVLGAAAGPGSPAPILAATVHGVFQLGAGGLGFALLVDANVAANAGIAWTKLDTAAAKPEDVGAAAIDHTHEPEDVGAAAAEHSHRIEDLSDVLIEGPTVGQVLVFNSALGVWQNDDPPEGGSGTLRGLSVLANAGLTPAPGDGLVAAQDFQVLHRVGATLRFDLLPRASLAPGEPCSVVGRAVATPGPLIDIPAGADDQVLLRLRGVLRWLGTVPRLRFGGEVGALVQFVAASGAVTHEYDGTGNASWRQLPAGRTRFMLNATDFWEVSAAGTVLTIAATVAGALRHRVVLDAALRLGGAARTIALREIDICDNGVARKMAVLASEPY